MFDIAQFFLLLNHQLLLLILNKAGFNSRIGINYLVDRKTKYLWNNFSFLFFNINVGIGQGLVLFLILSVLYLFSIFHIFEKRLKNLKISISVILFVNNSLFISQDKSFNISNSNLFYSYNIISSLLEQFRLVIEYRKIEFFHFSRLYEMFNPPPLDLTMLGVSSSQNSGLSFSISLFIFIFILFQFSIFLFLNN